MTTFANQPLDRLPLLEQEPRSAGVNLLVDNGSTRNELDPHKYGVESGLRVDTAEHDLVGAERFESFRLGTVTLPDGKVAAVNVYHGSDDRNDDVKAMEAGQMVDLGDPKPNDGTKGEFEPYFNSSFVIDVREIKDDGTESDRPMAMMRVAPYVRQEDAERLGLDKWGLKTFNDLATIAQVSKDEREREEAGKPPLIPKLSVKQIESKFIKATGNDDLRTTWDVVSLAFDEQIRDEKKVLTFETRHSLVSSLIQGLMNVGAQAFMADKDSPKRLTHLVSANANGIDAALDQYGVPSKQLPGYQREILWDLDGSGEAMVCTPKVIDAAKVIEKMKREIMIDKAAQGLGKLFHRAWRRRTFFTAVGYGFLAQLDVANR